jgi:hypothetical protein
VPLGCVQVLEGDRHAAQRRRVAGRQTRVGADGVGARLVGVDAHERVDGIGRALEARLAPVARVDAGQAGVGQLDRRQLAGLQCGGGLEHAEVGRISLSHVRQHDTAEA